MQHCQKDEAVVRLTHEIEDRLREHLRRVLPEHGQVGRLVGWKRRDMLAAKIPPAGVFAALFATGIVYGAPIDALRDTFQALDLIVLRERASEILGGPVPTDWVAALLAETDAQGPADSAQSAAIATRTTSDKRAARERLMRHRAGMERAIVALDRSIAEDEVTQARSDARVLEMIPA